MAYPDPIPCSGQISMGQVRDWMIAASELNSTTQVTLEQLVLNSRLPDKTAPYNLSQFYCYAIPTISCGSSFNILSNKTYAHVEDVVVGTTSGNVAIAYSIKNDLGTGVPVKAKIEVQYSGGSWVTVLGLTDVTTSISGTVNYAFSYSGSNTIKIRATKGVYYL